MNPLKRILWAWRIARTIEEIKQLAMDNANNPEYQTDALSIFLEYSSQSANMAKTTEADGEIIEMMFLERWNARYPSLFKPR